MKIAVHHHFNARRLCEIEVREAAAAKLAKPPAARDRYQPEKHVVELETGSGMLRLFPAKVNGVDLLVTNTPAVALANAV